MANFSSELSPFLPDQDFIELLWENGQIVMQGQSKRPRKSSFTNVFPSHSSRIQERGCRSAGISKIGLFGDKESPAAMGLNNQEDDISPWINYPIEDSLSNDYCSEFLSELSGINLSPFSVHNNGVPLDRSSGFGHTVREARNVEQGHAPKAQAGGSDISRNRACQLLQSPQQCQASEFGIAGSSSTQQSSLVNFHDRASQKPDVRTSGPPQMNNGTGLMNFSHFSRPTAIARSNRSNLQTFDRLRSNEKASTANSSYPVESTVVNSAGCLNQAQSTLAPPRADLRSSAKPPRDSISEEQSVAICREDASKNKHSGNMTGSNTRLLDTIICQSSTPPIETPLVRHEVEKGTEDVVASSSVCSISSGGVESNDPKHKTKRKIREGEESGYQSEDLEDESVGMKKHATGRSTNAKRGRAAEVHNLSERKRRDRINEKMRALQELIPNCNKVDKASMLDEAIEYLKTLQLQVQIMSMGTGLCMPPMMLPARMQHMRPHPMSHLSPMGINMGMGMGFGYGMGMMDANGSTGCPLILVPPMNGPQFPCTSMPGAPNLNGMPVSSSFQMFGIPGQGHPASMPRAPIFSGLPMKVNPVPEISRATTIPLPVADAAPLANPKDQEQQNLKLEIGTAAKSAQIQTSAQATTDSFEQSVFRSNQASTG